MKFNIHTLLNLSQWHDLNAYLLNRAAGVTDIFFTISPVDMILRINTLSFYLHYVPIGMVRDCEVALVENDQVDPR